MQEIGSGQTIRVSVGIVRALKNLLIVLREPVFRLANWACRTLICGQLGTWRGGGKKWCRWVFWIGREISCAHMGLVCSVRDVALSMQSLFREVGRGWSLRF